MLDLWLGKEDVKCKDFLGPHSLGIKYVHVPCR